MSPLTGIKVVDAAAFLTGPFAAMLLGDLGADVVKVEPPKGDPFRRFGERHNDVGISFMNVNRNKRSIALDLRNQDDSSLFHRLLADADVLITNQRPNSSRDLGLDETLLDLHPRLIWVRITGFGPDGPMADEPAFDSVIQGRVGVAMSQGDHGRPELVKSWLCDKVTGMMAAQTAMAALLQRQHTGVGDIVDLPMLDTMAYFDAPDLLVKRTIVDEPGTSTLNDHARSNRPVRASDGWLLLSPVSGRQISAALTVLGAADRRDELKGIADAAAMTDAFYAIAESALPQRTRDEWVAAFAAADVPAAAVFDLDEHIGDPQVQHNKTYLIYDDPAHGRVRQPRRPAAFARGSDRGSITAAPGLDQHRAELILALADGG